MSDAAPEHVVTQGGHKRPFSMPLWGWVVIALSILILILALFSLTVGPDITDQTEQIKLPLTQENY